MSSNELEAKILAMASKITTVNRETIEARTTGASAKTVRVETAIATKPKRKSKHGNVKTVVDGVTFDSAWEAQRWGMLLVKLRNGLISGLARQVPFKLHCPGGRVVSRYRADFVYVEHGQRVVEDAKGQLTAMYKLKRKWMLFEHGIAIKETYKKQPGTW
jgi:hypothetical protein